MSVKLEIPSLILKVRQALPNLGIDQKREVLAILEDLSRDSDGWPLVFINRDTNKLYTPHHDDELAFVEDNGTWRYGAAFGGEGGGKSVSGIIKTLRRLRAGCDGMMISPNLPHFQRSLWKEFQRWCPWDCVIPSHQRMADKSWMPVKPFDIVFSRHNNYLHCVGAKDVSSLEGPNLNFVHFDEARHFKDAGAVKVLDGRIRIDGPDGSRPQIWFTTTRMMNWLFDYFGPLECDCPEHGTIVNQELMLKGVEVQTGEVLACPICGGQVTITDEYADFKLDSTIISLPTIGNAANLTSDFVAKRGQTLTDAEADVLILDQWGEIQEGQPFLPTMTWWDTLEEPLPPLRRNDQLVLALDAATGRKWGSSDCFGILGVTRHPDPRRADTDVAVRLIHTWQAPARGKIDFRGTAENPGPERIILRLCGWDIDEKGDIVYRGNGYRVMTIVYDPNQLHGMATRLGQRGVAWFQEFSQADRRAEADRDLLSLIQRGGVAHDGNIELRMHLKNADRKLDSTGHKLRIVKRSKSRRVDLAVCLSMGSHECLRLNL
jgi:hypothetical protein